jgi:hypothetical protein
MARSIRGGTLTSPLDRRLAARTLATPPPPGEPGELVGGDVFGRAGGLADDELEIVAGLSVDDCAADALHAGVAATPERR